MDCERGAEYFSDRTAAVASSATAHSCCRTLTDEIS